MTTDIFSAPAMPLGLAVAPDGTQVALLFLPLGQQGPARLVIFRVNTPATATEIPLAEMLPPAGHPPQALTWSADGSMLAFTAPNARVPMRSDLYVLSLATGHIRSLTPTLGLSVQYPSWDPDGRSLACSTFEPPVRPGLPGHLFTVAVADGQIVQRTFGTTINVMPQFAPDGQALAFLRVTGSETSFTGDIWLLDLRTGTERQLTRSSRIEELGPQCFSPDGAHLVVEDGLSDARRIGVVGVATAALRWLTPPDVVAQSPRWAATGDGIAFVDRGQRAVQIVAPDGTLRWTVVPSGRGARTGSSLTLNWAARARVLALLDSDRNVWVWTPQGPLTQLTFFPPWEVRYQYERITYPAPDAASVPALLYAPPDADLQHRRAVIWVHGGPQSQADPRFAYLQALAAAGFVVLAPDYRGTAGYGEAWQRLQPDDIGMLELQDVVAGWDFLVRQELAKSERVSIAGNSYGGYLTLLALARFAERWAAGVSLWGAWDARSLASVVLRRLDRDAAWFAERSPLVMIERVRAPLLILHGAHDTASTVEQVQAAATTLRRQGNVCELKIFWDDGHGLSRHTNECCELMTAFLRRYLA